MSLFQDQVCKKDLNLSTNNTIEIINSYCESLDPFENITAIGGHRSRKCSSSLGHETCKGFGSNCRIIHSYETYLGIE